MSDYSTTYECYVNAEFDYDVSPGYRGSRTEPPEAASVENLRVTIVGPRGERLECPDWLTPLLAGGDLDWLLDEANGQREQALCDAADARRDAA